MSTRQRCLVAEDHPAIAAILTEWLTADGYEVLGPCGDGVKAVELAAGARPQLAIVDYRLPKLHGRELLAALAKVAPALRIVLFTGELSPYAARDLPASVHAVVLKDSDPSELRQVVAAVARGERRLDATETAVGLTVREREVLSALAEGLSLEQVAGRLGIAPATVRTHLLRAKERLGVGTKTAAVAFAIRNELIM